MIANILSLYFYSVPEAGVEPARPQWTQDFKSGASTDSATQALIYLSGKRDSNSRPRPWQGRALPTELFPQKLRFCGFSSRLGKTNKFDFALAAPKSPLIILCGSLSRLGKTNKSDFALAAPKSPLSKRRCKNTAFFNTVNVFLKKFYINYNLLIFNKKLPSFRL